MSRGDSEAVWMDRAKHMLELLRDLREENPDACSCAICGEIDDWVNIFKKNPSRATNLMGGLRHAVYHYELRQAR